MIARVYLRIADKEVEGERERERERERRRRYGNKSDFPVFDEGVMFFTVPREISPPVRDSRLLFFLECLSGGKELGVQII